MAPPAIATPMPPLVASMLRRLKPFIVIAIPFARQKLMLSRA
jgi:hypothetical protein